MGLVCLSLALLLALSGAAKPPTTRKATVVDIHHGVEVRDDYRWLEDAKAPAVEAWTAAQNRHARAHLDHLPGVDGLRVRVTKILKARTGEYFDVGLGGDALFAIKRQPPKQQPFLVVMSRTDLQGDKASGQERVLLDPNVLDTEGTTAIDWYVPSPDGRLVAVSVSKAGTESGDLQIRETATGRRVHEEIPRVNGGTAGGNLAWMPDGTGFYYTRYPRVGERDAKDMDFYVQIYFHKLGTPPAEDRYELGRDFPRIAEIDLDVDPATGRLLATVQNGDGGEFAHHLRDADGSWRQISRFGDRTLQVAFGRGSAQDDLFVISRKDTPRGKILRVSAKAADLSVGRVIVPQGTDTLVTSFWGAPSLVVTDTSLVTTYQLGGPSELRVFDHAGKPRAGPQALPVSAVGGLAPLGGDAVLFYNRSFLSPRGWFRFDQGKTHETALSSRSPVDFSDVKVVREMATSNDGTKIPVNIIVPKGARLDGSNPCVVSGYGGYGVSLRPRPLLQHRVLFDHGVIYAVANLRGGGEYGDEWHHQGNLTHKQNVFDDFEAVLRHMIARGYTRSDRLGIIGGSNGGLLMGALMTQHAKLPRAVVSYVGIYDMLRVELSPNGAFNITEFGTVKRRAHFDAMYAYSPYHRVQDGTAYPPTLFLTGANDPRVDPMQSRKMTARLQAATSGKGPILLRTTARAGHGGDTGLEERIAQTVDVYAFLLDALGVKLPATQKP